MKWGFVIYVYSVEIKLDQVDSALSSKFNDEKRNILRKNQYVEEIYRKIKSVY